MHLEVVIGGRCRCRPIWRHYGGASRGGGAGATTSGWSSGSCVESSAWPTFRPPALGPA